MNCNFINVRMKDKSDININENKILEVFKLSVENKITNLNYNKNKKESLNQNLGISYYKKFIQKNFGKMIYSKINNNNKTKIVNKLFLLNNMDKTKIIINNKQNDLKENIENENENLKIKINF